MVYAAVTAQIMRGGSAVRVVMQRVIQIHNGDRTLANLPALWSAQEQALAVGEPRVCSACRRRSRSSRLSAGSCRAKDPVTEDLSGRHPL